jgi:ferrous iron transport protein A
MGMRAANNLPTSICSQRSIGRILNYDHYGRIYALPGGQGRHKGAPRVRVLSELVVGEEGVIVALDLPESIQNHLMHMGFVPDAHITALRRAPAGDPMVYAIDGMEIALRHETASAIRVRPLEAEDGAAIEAAEVPGELQSTEFAGVAQ